MTDLAEARALDKRSVQNSSSGVVYELVEINAENFVNFIIFGFTRAHDLPELR
jgi:hypothetical protein